MKLEILVATIDAGIERAAGALLPPQEGIRYIVSHQLSGDYNRELPPALRRSDVLVSRVRGRGLAANRNNALGLAGGEVALLADDDATYTESGLRNVLRAFRVDAGLDVACFRIATPPGEPEYKDYPPEEYILSRAGQHYISSLEIAFRPERVRAAGISFDRRFGLGSGPVVYGEEAVFIHDCLRAGLKVKYIPEYVACHRAGGTATGLSEYESARALFKGAYDARRYGLLALPAAFYDTARFLPGLLGRRRPPHRYLAERLRGALYILLGAAGRQNK